MSKTMRTFPVLVILGLACACGLYGSSSSYTPPDLVNEGDNLTIGDEPLESGGQVSGSIPGAGRHLGFLFTARAGESYDITLERVSGSDVPALALYEFADGLWSEALAWASADATSITIGGWQVPAEGTYLVLVDLASGSGSSDFLLSLQCTANCEEPIRCAANADCPEGQVCIEGQCLEDNIECRSDSDCLPHEVCQQGLCVVVCQPSPETCDGIDNDCDGLVDENCQELPCTSDADCPAGEYCDAVSATCQPLCACASDADCPLGFICVDCLCLDDSCPDDDNDGYGVCQGDCDDADAAVFPGAAEECNGRDDDCDGVIDEGCSGDCTSDQDCAAGQICWEGVCLQPCRSDSECASGQVCMNGLCQADLCDDEDADGFTTCDGDCDDTDAAVNPAANEECDGVDNDCDGQVDEGCGACAGDADCASGEQCCAGQCVDVLFDAGNCGGCGLACAAGESCERGVCVAEQCSTDSDCDDGDPATDDYCINGVCTHR
ncbi:MAG: hypothetical protein DRI34_09350 [Deltaproteobacteria bacterium]|nr:MAG: hypothetical protein DRI34_09350 [Deltaproteobacteria bacterium]